MRRRRGEGRSTREVNKLGGDSEMRTEAETNVVVGSICGRRRRIVNEYKYSIHNWYLYLEGISQSKDSDELMGGVARISKRRVRENVGFRIVSCSTAHWVI